MPPCRSNVREASAYTESVGLQRGGGGICRLCPYRTTAQCFALQDTAVPDYGLCSALQWCEGVSCRPCRDVRCGVHHRRIGVLCGIRHGRRGEWEPYRRSASADNAVCCVSRRRDAVPRKAAETAPNTEPSDAYPYYNKTRPNIYLIRNG